MKKIAVIGAGTMGNGIAHVFAQKGYSVSLIDVSAEQLNKAIATIGKNLDRMISKGSISDAEKASTLANITPSQSMEDGLKEASLAVEAATENEAIKL